MSIQTSLAAAVHHSRDVELVARTGRVSGWCSTGFVAFNSLCPRAADDGSPLCLGADSVASS